MKKILFALSLVAVIFFASCGNITVPKSLGISTGASYKFNVTNVDQDLSSFFSIDSLLSNMSGNANGFNLYRYNPNGTSDKAQLLMEMNLQEIPIDFSSYLEQADFSSALTGMSVSKEITIPSIDINEEESVDMSSVQTTLNALVTITGSTGSEVDVNFVTTDSDTFTSIEYESGTLGLTSASGTITGTVGLYYGDTKLSEATASDGKVALPLTNVTIYKTGMKLKFSMGEGAVFGGAVVSTSKIKSAKGITVSTPLDIGVEPQTFETGNSSDLKSCVIGAGSTLSVVVDLSSWTMNSGSVSYDIDISGGLTASLSDSVTSADIGGQTYENENITANTNFALTLNNSDIVLSPAPTVTISTNITSIASATVEMGDSYETSVTKNQELPSEAVNSISNITWSPSGLKVAYTNTFPSGNDAGLDVTSTFFALTSNSQSIAAGTTEEAELNFLCAEDLSTDIGDTSPAYDTVDVNAEITLPGWNGTEKTVTIINVTPGETYGLSIEITPVFKWKAITLSTSFDPQSGSVSTGVNLSSLLSSLDSISSGLSSKIKLSTLDLYLFCDVPEVLDDASFTGKISAYIGESDGAGGYTQTGTERNYLLGSEASDAELVKVACPELTYSDEANTIVTNDLTTCGAAKKSLVDVVNESMTIEDSSMCVDYELSLDTTGGLTIEYSDFYNDDGSAKDTASSIQIKALGVIPMEFKAAEEFSIDLLGMVRSGESNSDLFGRSEATDLGDIEKFLDVVKSVDLYFSEPEALPFVSDSLSLNIDWDGSGDSFSTKTINLTSGGSVSIENLGELLETYPLSPTVAITLAEDDTLALANDLKIKTILSVGIKTDGSQTIQLF